MPADPARPALAFVGFGELAAALAAAVGEAGGGPLRAWSRPREDPGAADLLRERMQRAGVTPVARLEDAVGGAAAVLACVPGPAALELAREASRALSPGALYADLASSAPSDKEAAELLVSAAGGSYADVAVLGAVATSGASMPILVAGPGAAEFRDLGAGLGLDVEAIHGPAGAAARVKLLRSVYLKGRDALVAEMMLAARRDGLEQLVADSIAGPGEEVGFAELADRILRSLAVHAGRRAGELEESAALLRAEGIEPLATMGGAQRLRLLAELGLRDSFEGERPSSGEEVLERIGRLSRG